MLTTGAKLIVSFFCVGAFFTTDAAITAWSEPHIAGAANGNGTLSLPENQAINTTIKTYIATGAAPVTYALTPAVRSFALSTAGALSITAGLDYETTPTYTLLIVATENGGEKGTATITVTVTDVNEFDPVFSPTSYSPCIADKSPAGTTLTTVTATDKDTSQKITFDIHSGNTNTDFKIDGSSGLIQVNDAKTLNKTVLASYVLVVTAADNVAAIRTATTTVSVTVADSCDKGDNGDSGDKGDNGDKGDKGDNGHSGTVVAAVSIMMLIVSLFVTLY